jgi:hypothetical protein
MKETSSQPEFEHSPHTLGELTTAIFADASTQKDVHTDTLFGNGTKTTTQRANLEGWHDFVGEGIAYGGSMQLTYRQEEVYRWGMRRNTATSCAINYQYSTDIDGRFGGTGFNIPLDPQVAVDENDIASQLLLSHLQHKEKREQDEAIRAEAIVSLANNSGPYTLATARGMRLESKAHEQPQKTIRYAINALRKGAQDTGISAENPDYEASLIVATLEQVTHETLDDYGLTEDALQELVRRNYEVRARSMIEGARQRHAFDDYGGIVPFAEAVRNSLAKAGISADEIGTDDHEMATLDAQFAKARAAFAIRKIREASRYPQNMRDISEYQATVVEASKYLGVAVDDLGISFNELYGR